MRCQFKLCGARCEADAAPGKTMCEVDAARVARWDALIEKYSTYYCSRCGMSHTHDRDASLHS